MRVHRAARSRRVAKLSPRIFLLAAPATTDSQAVVHVKLSTDPFQTKPDLSEIYNQRPRLLRINGPKGVIGTLYPKKAIWPKPSRALAAVQPHRPRGRVGFIQASKRDEAVTIHWPTRRRGPRKNRLNAITMGLDDLVQIHSMERLESWLRDSLTTAEAFATTRTAHPSILFIRIATRLVPDK